jgi:flagellar assembly factor FliW
MFVMQIVSARFGSLEVPEDKVLSFPDGLLGFEQSKRFVICDHDEKTPFKWLQSVNDPNLAFVIISPFEFMPGYEVELGRDDVLKLGLKDVRGAAVYVLVTIPQDPSMMTANMQGPLVLNTETRTGRQVVLSDGKYQARLSILQALQSGKSAKDAEKSCVCSAPMVAVAK